MDYALIWFLLIGVLWTGYLVLEGFDFGVGALLPVLGKGVDAADTEKRRRVMLTTIGPHWDGNEVWLLTAGGATFAAFPHWYATMFSAFYLPLLILLVALIVRNMGFEYRRKRDDDTWRRRWDVAIIAGSILAPLLVGVALTNVVRGVPLDARHRVRRHPLDAAQPHEPARRPRLRRPLPDPRRALPRAQDRPARSARTPARRHRAGRRHRTPRGRAPAAGSA